MVISFKSEMDWLTDPQVRLLLLRTQILAGSRHRNGFAARTISDAAAILIRRARQAVHGGRRRRRDRSGRVLHQISNLDLSVDQRQALILG